VDENRAEMSERQDPWPLPAHHSPLGAADKGALPRGAPS